MDRILIVGATSAIAQATSRLFAKEGKSLFLVGRNKEKLEGIKKDLLVRGASKVDLYVADLNQIEIHSKVFDSALDFLGGIDGVLIAHGSLDNQIAIENQVDKVEASVQTNYLSPISLLTVMTPYFEKQKSGVLAVISSVAGDRGRRSNYVYGSAKAGLTAFLSGLRSRLFRSGVTVLTIKPGFVDTPLTANVKKNFLFATPEKVARGIKCAMERKKMEVYLPWFWRWVMLIIKIIPEGIFKRLSF